MLFFESSWWTDLSTLSTDNKSATSESGNILISPYDVTGVDGSIPLPSTSLLLFFQGNTVSLSFKSVEIPRFFSDGRSLGHITSTSHSRVYVYVYVSLFLLKARRSSNSHTSKARAKNFRVPQKGRWGSAQHRHRPFFLLPLDANAITWYRFRQKHHSNHHIIHIMFDDNLVLLI